MAARPAAASGVVPAAVAVLVGAVGATQGVRSGRRVGATRVAARRDVRAVAGGLQAVTGLLGRRRPASGPLLGRRVAHQVLLYAADVGGAQLLVEIRQHLQLPVVHQRERFGEGVEVF